MKMKKQSFLSEKQNCRFCKKIPKVIIDAPTKFGSWAYMCYSCHKFFGKYTVFGIGKGQKFENKENGRKLK